jgi:hypothetical protein
MANPGDTNTEAETDDAGPVGRVHELAWALFDEVITDAELAELEGLLLNDATAREAYIRCVQLHAELAAHFNPPKLPKGGDLKTPVLGFLGDAIPQFGASTDTVQ